MTATAPGIVVRKCHSLEDFHLCVSLQRQVWGEADLEVEPVTAFIVADQTGGQVFGAFDGERLAGFTMAVVGIRDGQVYFHSHMTGVHRDYRDRGIGRMLKLFQREEALSRDVRLICWTFDPLEFRNAYFNLNRLGAISRKYLPNLYGVTSSPLHRGLATDRLLVEWHLDSPRVIAAVSGAPIQLPEFSVLIAMPPHPTSSSEPSPAEAPPQDPSVEQPQSLQSRLREDFLKYFQRGYATVAVRKDTQAPAYILCPWSDF